MICGMVHKDTTCRCDLEEVGVRPDICSSHQWFPIPARSTPEAATKSFNEELFVDRSRHQRRCGSAESARALEPACLIERHKNLRAVLVSDLPQHAVGHQPRLPTATRIAVGEEKVDLAFDKPGCTSDCPSNTVLDTTGNDGFDNLTWKQRALDHRNHLELSGGGDETGFVNCTTGTRPGHEDRVTMVRQLTRICRRDNGGRPCRPRPQDQQQRNNEQKCMPSHTYQYPYRWVEHQHATRENGHFRRSFNKPFNKVLKENHPEMLKLAGSAGSRP